LAYQPRNTTTERERVILRSDLRSKEPVNMEADTQQLKTQQMQITQLVGHNIHQNPISHQNLIQQIHLKFGMSHQNDYTLQLQPSNYPLCLSDLQSTCTSRKETNSSHLLSITDQHLKYTKQPPYRELVNLEVDTLQFKTRYPEITEVKVEDLYFSEPSHVNLQLTPHLLSMQKSRMMGKHEEQPSQMQLIDHHQILNKNKDNHQTSGDFSSKDKSINNNPVTESSEIKTKVESTVGIHITSNSTKNSTFPQQLAQENDEQQNKQSHNYIKYKDRLQQKQYDLDILPRELLLKFSRSFIESQFGSQLAEWRDKLLEEIKEENLRKKVSERLHTEALPPKHKLTEKVIQQSSTELSDYFEKLEQSFHQNDKEQNPKLQIKEIWCQQEMVNKMSEKLSVNEQIQGFEDSKTIHSKKVLSIASQEQSERQIEVLVTTKMKEKKALRAQNSATTKKMGVKPVCCNTRTYMDPVQQANKELHALNYSTAEEKIVYKMTETTNYIIDDIFSHSEASDDNLERKIEALEDNVDEGLHSWESEGKNVIEIKDYPEESDEEDEREFISCDICADFSQKQMVKIPEFVSLKDLMRHIVDWHIKEEKKTKLEEIVMGYNIQFEENPQNEYEGGKECAYWMGLYQTLYSNGYPKDIERIFESKP